MPRYKIVKDRLLLPDERFEPFLEEALSFFNKLMSVAGSPPPNDLTDSYELIVWRDTRWKEIQENVENIRHKIQAINYSLSLVEEEIKLPPIIGQKVMPIDLRETEFLDDVILFEFESFLFQVFSTLDVFVHLLKLFYPVLDSEKTNQIGFKGVDGKAGKVTIKKLRKEDRKLADYFDKEVKSWIQEISELRHKAAHKSKVSDLQMFLIDENGFHLPKLNSKDEDLLDFCKNTYHNLSKFIFTVENDYLLKRSSNYYSREEFEKTSAHMKPLIADNLLTKVRKMLWNRTQKFK